MWENAEKTNKMQEEMAVCPCSRCGRDEICHHRPIECASFRGWFYNNWRTLTTEIKTETKEYIRFRLIYKD